MAKTQMLNNQLGVEPRFLCHFAADSKSCQPSCSRVEDLGCPPTNRAFAFLGAPVGHLQRTANERQPADATTVEGKDWWAVSTSLD